MKVSDIKKVCVVGAGLMGSQIALNNAIYGFDTYLTDSSSSALEKVDLWAKEYLRGRVDKGRLTWEKADSALKNFHVVSSLEEASTAAQLIIEAIIEDREIKMEFYKKLNTLAPENCIFATNSSYMVSSKFKDAIDYPSRLANMHYFNPALSMPLVEIVRGEHTADETVNLIYDFSVATGKVPIVVNKEIRGFVVARILTAIRDEAYFLVENGICSPEDCDIAVRNGLNHPMGPFELLDLTGIDLNYLSMVDRIDEGESVPPGFEIAKAKYEAGEWGRKTGKGFYIYESK